MNEYQKEMEWNEAIQRLESIQELAQEALDDGRPMLNYSWDLFQKIQGIARGNDLTPFPISKSTIKPLQHVIISCDASITKNPGGKVAVGVVIEFKDEPGIDIFRLMPKSKTNNEGEYDAIYVGLTQLMTLKNNPGCEVEIRSDSKVIVDQINDKIKCNKPELIRRRDAIRELALELPVLVSFQWKPRNSTPGLERANYLAQDALGVPRH